MARVAGAGTGKARGAIHPTGALDHRCGQNARFAEHFQRDARADDVHNRIHRADFVKMNLLRRKTVDFSFRHGNALKNRDGFFLHPGRQPALYDRVVDFGKCPVLVVVMVAVRDDRVGDAQGVPVVMIVVMVMGAPGGRPASPPRCRTFAARRYERW